MSKTILGTSLAVVGAAIAGGVASGGGVDDWYAKIRKPRYVPPNAVFPIAWTALYTDIAVTSAAAAAAVLTASSADLARRAAVAEPKLGAALAPYPLWCGFATVMATHIWRLNR